MLSIFWTVLEIFWPVLLLANFIKEFVYLIFVNLLYDLLEALKRLWYWQPKRALRFAVYAFLQVGLRFSATMFELQSYVTMVIQEEMREIGSFFTLRGEQHNYMESPGYLYAFGWKLCAVWRLMVGIVFNAIFLQMAQSLFNVLSFTEQYLSVHGLPPPIGLSQRGWLCPLNPPPKTQKYSSLIIENC